MKKMGLSHLLIISFLLSSAQQSKLTLQQCIETGITNNLDVLQSDLQAQADEIRWKQAKLNRLPDLNASGNYSFNAGPVLISSLILTLLKIINHHFFPLVVGLPFSMDL